MTEDNPAQQLQATQLAQEIAATIDAANARIAARRVTGRALTLAELTASEIAMDSVRTTSRLMRAGRGKATGATLPGKLRAQGVGETRHDSWCTAQSGILPARLDCGFPRSQTSASSRQTASGLFASLERRVAESAAIHAALTAEQAKLRASEEQSQLLLDGVADYAICMLDGDGLVVSWNTGAAKILGYRSEEILGKPSAAFFVAEQQAAGEPESDLQIARLQGRFEGEGARVRKSGEVFWANVILAAMYDSAGVLRGFSKVLRDVTGEKQADAAVKKQAALLDLAPDAIFARDMDNRIIYWNRGAEKLYGWSPEEAMGR